jgi:hypothetical protein
MNLRFYLDPETGEPHTYNHGVTEDEVEDVLRTPGEDRPGREGARVALGQTRAGRYLRVIDVPDPQPHSLFVITRMSYAGDRWQRIDGVAVGEESDGRKPISTRVGRRAGAEGAGPLRRASRSRSGGRG